VRRNIGEREINPKTQVPNTGTWGTLRVILICEREKSSPIRSTESLWEFRVQFPGHPAVSFLCGRNIVEWIRSPGELGEKGAPSGPFGYAQGKQESQGEARNLRDETGRQRMGRVVVGAHSAEG